MEKITIVAPSLNQEKFIPNLLTSLKRQTFQDFKVLVIDSYSSDNSVKLFKEYEKIEIIIAHQKEIIANCDIIQEQQ